MQSDSIKLFQDIMSPQKEIRESAEKTLQQLKELPLPKSIPVFNEGMSSNEESIFQLSTLLFKKTFCDDKDKFNSIF